MPHASLELLSSLPLQRSPATWVGPAVTLPPDIHPLPDDLSPYFVYNFDVEQYVLAPPPPTLSHAEQRARIRELHESRLAYLRQREDDKEKRKKDALRKVAPGWEGSSSAALEPKRMSVVMSPEPIQAPAFTAPSRPPNALDDLADLSLN